MTFFNTLTLAAYRCRLSCFKVHLHRRFVIAKIPAMMAESTYLDFLDGVILNLIDFKEYYTIQGSKASIALLMPFSR